MENGNLKMIDQKPEQIAAKILEFKLMRDYQNCVFIQMYIDVGVQFYFNIYQSVWKSDNFIGDFLRFFDVYSFDEIKGKFCYVNLEKNYDVISFQQFPCYGYLKIEKVSDPTFGFVMFDSLVESLKRRCGKSLSYLLSK
jgi:hypothetical protein